jgi:hypothetical protein
VSKPLIERVNFAKIITVLAIVFGVSLGLCGLTAALNASGIIRSNEEFGDSILVGTGILELLGMAVSGVGLVVTTIVWVIASAVSPSSRRSSDPQRLFDDENDRDKDENS